MLSVLCIVTGCASTDKQESTKKSIDHNAKFTQLITQFKKSPESVTYDKLWHVYLKSDQIDNSGVKQDEYMQLVQKLENREIGCAEINWESVTLQNFWSIKPHISAQTCYESLGNTEQASFHASVIEFLLSGILSNGDGKSYYSAYEIATWGDASDVIEFSGYEVIDSFLELKHYGQALYYIYVVNDPETGFQKEVYFENNKFIHEVLGVQYPFASINDHLKTEIVDFLSKTDPSAKIAKAKTLISERKYDEAIQMYLSATNDGSAVANYLLGVLCHSKKQSVLPQSDCADYLFQSAEMGYINATIALAFAHKEGVEVEQNEQISAEIMSSVEGLLGPGEAWFKFASFYNGVLGIKDDVKYLEYLNKAAELGSVEAEFVSVMKDINNVDDNDKKEIENITNRLKVVADKGLDKAQATYANILLRTNKKGSKKRNEAKVWLNKSAAQDNPFANYLLGEAYEYDYFGEKDLLKAYLAYNKAAHDYHPDSQLKVGYFNDIGRVVETDKRLAMSWYFLCVKASNLNCARNLGVHFQDGIVVEQSYEAALHYYKFSSDRGHAQSTTNLALLYWFGNGTEKNVNKANELFQKACELKEGEACTLLGSNFRDGKGVEVNLDEANSLFLKSCDYGHVEGCYSLATAFEKGLGVEMNYPQATKLYKKSCDASYASSCSDLSRMYRITAELGDPEAQYQLGMSYLNGEGVKVNIQKGIEYLRASAKQNYAKAYARLAKMYDYGWDVPINLELAVQLYHLAASLGDGTSQANLGYKYESGKGVEKNTNTALKFYELSAEQKNDQGLNNLASFYFDGTEVSQDKVKAIQLYKEAAALGNDYALNNLGKIYRTGDGVERDEKLAFNYFKRAAELDFIEAYEYMGIMSHEGKGTEQDDVKAIEYLEKASSAGYMDASLYLGEIYYNSPTISQNLDKAISYCEMSYEQGNANAASYLAWLYDLAIEGNRRPELAVKWYKKALAGGVDSVIDNLAVLYFNGDGVIKDEERAISLFIDYAKAKGSNANFYIGNRFFFDKRIPQDYQQAKYYYEKAMDENNAGAMNNLGEMYRYGNGVKKDLNQARALYLKAVSLNSKHAMFNLGEIYRDGDFEGVDIDLKKSFSWFKQASDEGFLDAQFELGKILIDGIGVNKNVDEGIDLIRLSAEAGYRSAQTYLEEYAETL